MWLKRKSLDAYLSLADFEAAARARLPAAVYGYASGGTEDQISLRKNRDIFSRVDLIPQGFVGVAERSQVTTLWGKDYASPVGVAPMGVAAMCRYNCDLEIALAAKSRRVPYILSGASCTPLEEIQAAGADAWYQGYFPGDEAILERIIERLTRAQVQVLAVTCDTPVGANRENNQRNGFTIPFRPSWQLFWDGVRHPGWSMSVFAYTLWKSGIPKFANLGAEPGFAITDPQGQSGFRDGRDRFTWEHMRWLRARWPGKLLVKGVMSVADARKAADLGMDGVIVSNHGGRQLDGVAAPLSVLPKVVAGVPADFPVFIDGGFRRGTDVIKALALGARMVFIGRPVLYGAAVAGTAGAARVFDILWAEIDRNLALLGCNRTDALDQRFLQAD